MPQSQIFAGFAILNAFFAQKHKQKRKKSMRFAKVQVI